jgi:hypothetical protein
MFGIQDYIFFFLFGNTIRGMIAADTNYVRSRDKDRDRGMARLLKRRCALIDRQNAARSGELSPPYNILLLRLANYFRITYNCENGMRKYADKWLNYCTVDKYAVGVCRVCRFCTVDRVLTIAWTGPLL